jgi:hypothetical protein
MKFIYMSQKKVDGIEDSLVVAPYLYKLQKSILLSEPTESMFNPLNS